jgi:hypothetical protein
LVISPVEIETAPTDSRPTPRNTNSRPTPRNSLDGLNGLNVLNGLNDFPSANTKSQYRDSPLLKSRLPQQTVGQHRGIRDFKADPRIRDFKADPRIRDFKADPRATAVFTLFALSLAGGARSNDWSSAKTKTHRTLVLARTAVAVAKALLHHSFL